MYLFKPCSAEPPHKPSHILRAKQLWPLIYPLYDPAFKHICHLNIHQSASLAWAWERGQCYQRADPIPESPQAPTCSLPTPWVTLPRTHTPELLVLHFWFVWFFFQAQFAFQPLNEGSASMRNVGACFAPFSPNTIQCPLSSSCLEQGWQ